MQQKMSIRFIPNITIDLGGGTCDKIYYQSQIDNGDNARQWNDDLRIGISC